MTDLESAQWGGIKLVSLVFGIFGAALGISYAPKMTRSLAISALLSGLFCSGFGPEAISFFFYAGKPLTQLINNFFAGICGMLGMFFIPGIMKMGQMFKDDPWYLIDRLRGVKKPDESDKDIGEK